MLQRAGNASHEFGTQGMPSRGTFYKSQNFCGTWVNDNLNVPFFTSESTAFTLDMSKKINKEDGLMIARETLRRLTRERPQHKAIRRKFNPLDEDCLKEQNNKKMTFEDNIHQGESETFFQNSLREVPVDLKTLVKATKADGQSDSQKVADISLMVAPPSFYDQDVEKWLTKKFARA